MKLIVEKFGSKIKEVDLEDGKEYFLGRQEDCDVVLSCKAVISRKHLKISQSENQLWTIECLSELNGLYLNGEDITGVEMNCSTVLSFFEYTFKFTLPEEEKKEEVNFSENFFSLEEPPKETNEEEFKETPEDVTKVLSPLYLNYSLSISIEGEPPQYVDLNEGSSWSAGRGEECDIILEHKYLTKKHFEIHRENNDFKIKDLGSSNGTFLNNKKLQAQKSYILKSQDIISVGDVEIVFKAHNKELQKISDNLPALSTEETPKVSMALPKVLLEESAEEEFPEETTAFKKTPFSNKKRLLLYGSLGVFLLILLLFGTSKKEDPAESQAKKEADEKMQAIETAYSFASTLMSQHKYALCVEELDNLHKLTPYYKDSQQLLIQCQTAVDNQKRADELREQEEAAEKVRQKVAQLVEVCEKKLNEFQSLEDLNECLADAIVLDPSNEKITEMQNFLEHKAEMKRIKEEKKKAFQMRLKRKISLYKKAKNLKDKGETLKAVPVYERFLAVAKGSSSLKDLHDKASQELHDMKTTYEETLNQLYENCETLIKNSQMKSAYYTCLKILEFKKEDQKALTWIKQAKKYLKDKLKPVYEKSALEESLSNVTEAMEMWQKILKEDVETGYYYKKAQLKLDKYK